MREVWLKAVTNIKHWGADIATNKNREERGVNKCDGDFPITSRRP